MHRFLLKPRIHIKKSIEQKVDMSEPSTQPMERSAMPCIIKDSFNDKHPFASSCIEVGTLIFASWAFTISRYTADTTEFEFRIYGAQGSATVQLSANGDLEADLYLSTAKDELQRKLGPSSYHSIRLEQKRPSSNKTFSNLLLEYHERNKQELMVSNAGTVEVSMEFDPMLVNQQFSQRIMATFIHAISVLAKSGSTALSHLDIISPQDQYDLTAILQESPPNTVESTVHGLIATMVERQPTETAIDAWDGVMSYSQLDHCATEVSKALYSRGVRPGHAVPVLFEKSKWALVGILGVWRAGAYYVPLDASYPRERLMHLVHATKATTIVCGSTMEQQARQAEVDILVLPLKSQAHQSDTISVKGRDPFTSQQHGISAQPTDLAYTMFTSGSTGNPKGVMMEHGSLCSSIVAMGEFLGLNPGTRITHLASLTFDISVFEIVSTLVFGGCVCIPSEEQKMNDLAGFVREYRVNTLASTPSISRAFDGKSIPSLHTVLLGGEKMLQSDKDQWSDSDVSLFNVYGPTETCIACSLQLISTSTAPDSIGSGTGLSCCRLWIVDAENEKRLVPIGAVGELCVEGPNVARGYLNDSELTESVFATRPAWMQNHSDAHRMYKTGDLVFIHPDGTLRYVGRKDSQVKVRGGYRVELGEVENAILKHTPGWITAAVELLVPKGTERSVLISVLGLGNSIPNDNEPETKRFMQELLSQLQPRLESTLPSYMIPDGYVPLHQLPMNSSGKLDRKALLDMLSSLTMDKLLTYSAESSYEESQNSTPPADPVDDDSHRMLEICAKVLNLKATDMVLDRSFVRNGGDSIAAMQVISQFRDVGKALRVSELLSASSLYEAASAVRDVRSQDRIVPQEQPGHRFKLSPIQKLLMDVAPSPREWNHYNQSFLMRLKIPASHQDWNNAVAWLVERHSMLRARFEQTSSGEWVQFIDPEPSTPYVLNIHEASIGQQVRTSLMDASRKGLNLHQGPLLRVDVFDDVHSQLVFMTIHHLVVDLVSWRIIIRELQQLFTNWLGQPPRLERPFSFQSWVKAQHDHFRDPRFEDPAKTLKADVPPPDFEFWGIDPKSNLHEGSCSQKFTLGSAFTRDLLHGRHHQVLRTEPIDVLLSALVISFKKTFPERGVPTIMNESHGREAWHDGIELSRTVGWFTTLFPVYDPDVSTNDIVNTVMRMKDARKSIASNGWEYFGCRALTDRGEKRFGRDLPAEIAFNYEGSYGTIEQESSILREENWTAGEDIADASPTLPRFTLFEISSSVLSEQLHFTFVWHRAIQHQERVLRWTESFEKTLVQLCSTLRSQSAQLTRSDVPLLDADYPSLAALTRRILAIPNVTCLEDIEAVYPCTPTQKSLALSQARDAGVYQSQMIWKVQGTETQRVDPFTLATAWGQVVARHSALRTVFVEGASENSAFEQVVLRHHKPETIIFTDVDASKVALSHPRQISKRARMAPEHRMIICSGNDGSTFCRLEVTHLLCDGMSIPPLLRDLSLAYGAQLAKSASPRFSDFVSYICDRERHSESISFWERRLSQVKPCLFPTMPDPVLQDNEQRELKLRLDIDYSEIQSSLKKAGLTLPTLFQMVWALTLQRYTGKDHVAFGYIVSGRDAPIEFVDDIIGVLIGVLVKTVDLSIDATVLETMQSIQQDSMECLDNQACSLAEIHHALGIRDGGLFNSGLAFQSPMFQTASALSFRQVLRKDPTEYDIALVIESGDQSIDAILQYQTRSFSDEAASNIAKTAGDIVSKLIHGMENHIVDIPAISPEDETAIWKWNERLIAPAEECAHHAIELSMRAHPHRLALRGWDGDMTYGELNILTHSLATFLVESGVRPESVVPICFPKSNWAVVAMLAVLRAGGCFVMLDPGHPDDRILAIVDEVNPTVIISSKETDARMKASGRSVFCLSTVSATTLPVGDILTTPCPTLKPDDAMYVIFTSGTTGVPKGVVVTHRAFSSGFDEHVRVMCLSPGTRLLQFAAYSFDASVVDVMCTLKVGGCLCTPSDTDRGDIVPFIARTRANWAGWTPSFAALIDPHTVPTLEVLVVAGEMLPRELVDTWAGSVKLLNVYGPSECSVACTAKHVIAANYVDASNIGCAYRAVTWIVDENNHERLRPVGAIGELLIEGPALARGYLNREDATARSFIRSPSWLRSHRPHSRLYKTGDLARYNLDGSISFIGRKDSQIKINGQRVELGDIEYHLRKCLPAPTPLAVDLMRREPTNLLAAFIVIASAKDGSNDAEDIIAYDPHSLETFRALVQQIRSTSLPLPAYMAPHVYIPLKTLPTTSSGKLDRVMLQRVTSCLSVDTLVSFATDSYRTSVEEYTREERILLELWKRTLGLSTVDLNDNFFSVGGCSLTAIRLSAAARNIGLDLPVVAIFQNPVAVNMAKMIGGSSPVDSEAAVQPMSLLNGFQDCELQLSAMAAECGVPTDTIEDVFPCTPLQESLMAISARGDGLVQPYVTHASFRLPRDMQVPRFLSAWDKVCAQHGILRARILLRPKGALVVVTSTSSLVKVVETPCNDYLEEQRHIPFDYGQPLLRLAVTKDGHFVFSAHHACYDGWSLDIVWNAVARFYHNRTIESPWPPFQRFVQHISLSSSIEDSNRFWKQALQDKDEDLAATFAFPSCPAGHRPVARQRRVYSARIPQVPSYLPNLTTSSVLTAAYAICIAQYGGSTSANFGATVFGRDLPIQDIEKMVGPTLATIPRRISVQSKQTAADFLRYVHEDIVVASMPHSTVSVSQIMQLSVSARQACDFQSTLTIHPKQSKPALEELGVEALPIDTTDFHPYPLVLDCWLGDACEDGCVDISFEMYFDPFCVPEETVSSLLRHLDRTLHGLCEADATDPIASVTSPCAADLNSIIDWASSVPPPVEACIIHTIESNAASYPHRTALTAKEGTWTYAELNEQAEHLARQLANTELGGPDRFVGICFEKSGYAVVAMLAIWKAGGAYVPLDPAHPPTRLLSLIERAGVSLVLTSVTTKQLLVSASGLGVTIVCVERDLFSNTAASEASMSQSVRPNHAAYMIFTSGSTGEPKGVVLEHRALSSSIRSMDSVVPLDTSVRMLQYANFTFDLSVQEIFHTLSTGGLVCMPSDSQRLDGLLDFINAHSITAISLTPSVLRLLQPADVPSVTIVICGGEPLAQSDITTWASVEGLRFVNEYGPTEVCISIARNIMAADTKANMIGKSVAMSAWVISPTTNTLAPIGAIGELYLQGPNIARGYHSDEKRTVEAFIQNPPWLPADHSGTVYRSGDMASYNTDGSLTLLGRRDGQIKIRGQRVETGEIAEWARTCIADGKLPFSNAAVLFYKPPVSTDGKRREPFLVALLESATVSGFVVLHQGDAEKHNLAGHAMQLKQKLRTVLAGYMVPTAYVAFAHLPKTTSGKLNTRLIHDMLEASEGEGSALVGPREAKSPTDSAEHLTPDQCCLRQCWSEVLGRDVNEIGLSDEFFDLGGSSITAIRLVSLIKAKGYALRFRDIMAHQRLDEMSTCLKEEQKQGETEERLDTAEVPGPFELLNPALPEAVLKESLSHYGIDFGLVEDVYPCTPFQESLIAATMRSDQAYMSFHSFGVPDNVDEARMQDIWNQVARQFELLRTRIIPGIGSGPTLQVVLRSFPPWHRVSDASDVTSTVRTETWKGGPLAHMIWISSGRVVLAAHHALYDGQSFSAIWRDIATRILGRPTPSPPVPFRAFIQQLARRNEESSASYWHDRLDGVDYSALPLAQQPADYQPTATCSVKESAQLGSLAAARGSATALIYAAWGLTLAHFSGSRDAVFTAILSGREMLDSTLLAVAGPTMAASPFYVQLEPTTTVDELLNRVSQDLNADMENAHFGLNRIARLNENARQACASESLVVVQPPPDDIENEYANLSSLEFRPLYESQAFLPHAIVLEVQLTHNSSTVSASLAYDSHLLYPRLAQGMMDTFAALLACLSNDSHSTLPLSSLPAASPADLAELRQRARSPVVVDSCAHQLLQTPTANRPAAIAVDAWDGTLTYSELDELSSALAFKLVAKGVKSNRAVPILLGKTKYVPVAMLAVWKAGGFWIPLEVSWPMTRKKIILDKIDIAVMLVSAHTAAMGTDLLMGMKPLVVVDRLDGGVGPNCEAPALVPHFPHPSDLAYVMFTSGSTGTPKGVMVSHRALSSALVALCGHNLVGASSRVAHQTSISFDLALAEIFLVLCAGGTVCIPSDADCLDNLPGFIETARITEIFCTPSLSRLFDPDTLPDLRGLHLGGEPMFDADKYRWCNRVNLNNGFGPTEACIATAIRHIDSANIGTRDVGRGLPHCRLWIAAPLSNGNSLAPIGGIGEVYIEGPSVANGYLGDSKATAEAFLKRIPETWFGSDKSIESLELYPAYRTGDLARYDEHGSLHYVGRKDALQVKLNGQRVELGDIESALTRLLAEEEPGTSTVTVAVDVWESVPGQKMLIGVLAVGKRPDADAYVRKVSDRLRHRLLDVLPRHMQPRAYISLDSLPTTVAGKFDRRALKLYISSLQIASIRALHATDAASEELDLKTDEENLVADLWAATLSVHRQDITRNQNFFASGGDSLSAMRLVSAARQHGFELTTQDLFRQPTLAAIAANLRPFSRLKGDLAQQQNEEVLEDEHQLRSLVWDVVRRGHPTLFPTDASANAENVVFPCLPTQETMMEAGRVVSFVFLLKDTFDLPRFQNAVKRCATHHPIWRTRIVRVGTALHQVIFPSTPSWRFPAGSLEDALEQESRIPMGVGDPLIRFSVVNEGTHLIWTQHHSTYDAWSLSLMFEHLTQTYLDSTYQPASSVLPFHTFATRLHRLARSGESDMTNFWASYFRDSTSTPPLFGYGAIEDPNLDRKAQLKLRLEPNLRDTSATIAEIVTAAWILTLARLAHSRDITIGYVVNGRSSSSPQFWGLESTVGPTLNTIPLRANLSHLLADRHDFIDDRTLLREVASLVHDQILHISMAGRQLDAMSAIRTASPEAESAINSLPLNLVVHLGDQQKAIQGPIEVLDLSLQDARPTISQPKGGFSVEAEVHADNEVEFSIFWDARAVFTHANEVQMVFEALSNLLAL
ncbi:hypothetical protein M3J09_013775 [Ascochyta lentis]